MEVSSSTQEPWDNENREGNGDVILDAEREKDTCLQTGPSKKGESNQWCIQHRKQKEIQT